MKFRSAILSALVVFLIPQISSAQTPAKTEREVAITIDDLPAGSAQSMTAQEIADMTAHILTTLKQYNVPAVGFVNESKVYKLGETDQRIQALNMWLDAGMELGNHTFAHTSLNRVPLAQWEEEVMRGETVTKFLIAQHGNKPKLRYLRHPYLDTGRDLQTRRDAEKFLSDRGYRIAPVTLDAWDWAFGGIYGRAKKAGDSALQKEVVEKFLAYHNAMFEYDEKLSRELFGHEPKQILLLHGTELEGDHLASLLELLKKRGYKFITLEDALSDSVYGSPDTYVGEEGTGWLEHWAISRGIIPRGAPEFPKEMQDRMRAVPPPPGEKPGGGPATP